MAKRIVVAMSGGVDSAVTAALLHKIGYEVVGITMKLYNSDGGCCSVQDINDAKRVAALFGFKHHVINYASKFKTSVIDYFIDSYTKGATPLPCVKCNQDIKFSELLKAAKMLGGHKLATGHYAKIENGKMCTSVNSIKDQTYYLFPIEKSDLDFIEFPLGVYSKSEVREIAKNLGIEVYNKADSQDICFVTNGTYRDFILKRKDPIPGEVIDIEGNVIGYHGGILNYTIGQRRGVKIGGMSERAYVIAIDPERNTVTLGRRSELMKKYVVLKDFNNMSAKAGQSTSFKFRANQKPIPSKILHMNSSYVIVELIEPDYSGIACGQAGVGYVGNVVIGGGWIIDSGNDIADIEKYLSGSSVSGDI